ncbi:MAG: hypothetical protein AB1649_06765 [Chloroflexota bacterium]
MSRSINRNEYYFVSLGREPGGYMDFLGLPPDASEGAATQHENDYRNKLDVELRTKTNRLATRLEYQNLKEKQRKNEKSESEVAQEVGKLKEKYVTFNARLLKLAVRLKEKTITQEVHDEELERLQADFEALVAESDVSQITREEMETEVEKWQKEKSDRLEHLNKLKEAYQLLLANQRDLRNKGVLYKNELWQDMFIEFRRTPGLFWKLALAHRPLMNNQSDVLSNGLQEQLAPMYLEFLGLSSNATEVEVRKHDNDYRNKLDDELKTKANRLMTRLDYQNLKERRRKNEKSENEFAQEVGRLKEKYVNFNANRLKLTGRLKEKAITQEVHDEEMERLRADFDALAAESDVSQITREEMEMEVEKWNKGRHDRLEHLNQLKETYQIFLSNQRELRNKGFSPGGKLHNSLAWEPQQAIFPTSLVRLDYLYDKTCRYFLDWADLLWERQTGTNRALWQHKVENWIQEIQESGPTFKFETRTQKKAINPEFPALSMPTPLTIDKLEAEKDIETLEQGPQRQQPVPKRTLTLEEFLAAMTAQGGPASAADKPKPGQKKAGPDPDELLLDLLKKMAEAAAKNKRKPPGGNPKGIA